MRVHIKMFIVCFLLVAVLIVSTGFFFYRYAAAVQRAGIEDELVTVAEKLSLQVESRIQQIDVALLFILSDPDFLSSVAFATMPEQDDIINKRMFSDSTSTINRLFRSYAIDKHFFKVVLFDRNGNLFSSDFNAPKPTYTQVRTTAKTLSWLDRAEKNRGVLTLLPPSSDPWQMNGPNTVVYGAARAISTTTGVTCFVQVERNAAELEELLTLDGFDGVTVSLLDCEGDLFYTINEVEGKGGIEIVSAPNRFGLRARLVMDENIALYDLRLTAVAIVIIGLLLMLASFFYIYFAARSLTKPLRVLEQAMNRTVLTNLDGRELSWENDELKSLNDAFMQLCARLNTAVDEKIRAQNIEMQARLDALQAQIDPHFLFNTLNVIMSRAIKNDDNESIEVCQSLSDMLRYSTSTTQRIGSLASEKEHLQNYLYLMKTRYQHRLEYEILISPELLDLPMPKIILQPLVENAIRHGFTHIGGTMRLQIEAFLNESFLCIRVSDNGEGFDPCTLRELQNAFDAIISNRHRPLRNAEIGGMGLINTCERLAYFYGKQFSMRIENTNVGALVTLFIPRERSS